MLEHWISQNEGTHLLPEARTYWRKPTIAHASALLDALGLHIPSIHVDFPSPSMTHTVIPARPLVVSTGGARLTIERLLAIFPSIDFLHDIHGDARISTKIQDMVLDPLQLSPPMRKEIEDACRKTKSYEFTATIANIFEKKSNLNPTRFIFETMQPQEAFYQKVTEWMGHRELEVVLDGYWDVHVHNKNSPSTDVHVLRGLCLYAFFSLLLGSFAQKKVDELSLVEAHIHRPLPQGVRTIYLLTGDFQRIDNPKWNKFQVRFIEEFNKSVHGMVMKMRPISNIPPLDARFLVNKQETGFQGHRIPIKGRIPNQEKRDDSQVVADFQEHFHTSYSKTELRTFLRSWNDLAKADRNEAVPFIQRVILINAFRDMSKADVALQRNALYLTVDRMAHLYYGLRAREQNLDAGHGLYYFPRNHKETTMAIFTPST